MHKQQMPTLEAHTTAWNVQVWVSWLVSTGLTLGGLWFLTVDPWARGYLFMGTLFTLGSTFTLAKTVRDNHEAKLLRNRISQAKTDKLLKEFELTDAA